MFPIWIFFCAFIKFLDNKISCFALFRKEYEQHKDEDDRERVDQIMERALKDAEWILKKYNK